MEFEKPIIINEHNRNKIEKALDEGKYYFPIEDEKNNSLILKIERVDEQC